jgi:hypothetical protein
MKHIRQYFGRMEDCIDLLDRYNDRNVCRKLPVNVAVESPLTSNLSVDCLELYTDRMLNKPLHIESAVRYKHHMKVMT